MMARRLFFGWPASRVLLLALAVVSVGACGGGGGGGAPTAAAPVVLGVVPGVVSNAIATRVTVRGVGLLGATAVDLVPEGGGPVASLVALEIASDRELRATVPAGTPTGSYDVRVATPAGSGQAGGMALQVVAAPAVASVAPPEGFNDGTTSVVLEGAGLAGTTSVVLSDPAGTALAGVVVEGDGRVRAEVPAGVAPGVWGVRATTSAGTSLSGQASFRVRNLVDPDLPGAFEVGTEDVTVPGASGDTPAARIYYPALERGEDAALDDARAPYPLVVFNHAFKPPFGAGGIDYRGYGDLCGHLASFGYVVISTDLVPNNDLFGSAAANAQRDADDARAALDYLEARNVAVGDRFEGLLDAARCGVGGHSRGGDASLIACADEAAARPTTARFLAVFVLGAPAFDPTTGGQPLSFGDFTSVPCLAFGASRDGVVPYADQLAIFAQAGPSSMAAEIVGGNHSQYTDTGQTVLLDDAATIPLSVQQAVVKRYVTAFLGTHVKGEALVFAPYVHAGDVFWNDARLRDRRSK